MALASTVSTNGSTSSRLPTSRPSSGCFSVAGANQHRVMVMATEATVVEIDRGRIKELADREEKRLDERTAASRAMYERARKTCPAASPPPTRCATRGRSTSTAASARRSGTSTGTRCSTSTTASARWCRGMRTRRSARRSRSGTRRARTSPRPTEDAIVVAEELARRLGLPKWRYTNSGSEATMDAIRIARGGDRPRHDHEDLRLLPRPPRLRDGLDRRPVRPHRRPRATSPRCRTEAGFRRSSPT